jgi:hypothetical protein
VFDSLTKAKTKTQNFKAWFKARSKSLCGSFSMRSVVKYMAIAEGVKSATGAEKKAIVMDLVASHFGDDNWMTNFAPLLIDELCALDRGDLRDLERFAKRGARWCCGGVSRRK